VELLFVAKAGKKEGYLTIKQANQQVIPFFSTEELQTMLDRFKLTAFFGFHC